MAVQLDWHIRYRVIDERIIGTFTGDDVQHVNKIVSSMLDEAQRQSSHTKVYLLFDLSEAERLPPAYLMIRQALPVLRYKNRGPMFLITRNRTIRSIVELTGHVMQFQVRVFATREQALEAITSALARDELHGTS